MKAGDRQQVNQLFSPSPLRRAQEQSNAIRNVDFKNFSYPWYPSHLSAPNSSRTVTLRNGKFEELPNPDKGTKYLLLEVEDVSYAKLVPSSEEQAIVYLRGISVTNRFVGCIFVYEVQGSTLNLLWFHETGDRADGGLKGMEVQDREIVVEQYTLDGAAGLCCPKKFVRRYFKWDGREFRNVKSEVLVDKKS